jgi:hypothetical protein
VKKFVRSKSSFVNILAERHGYIPFFPSAVGGVAKSYDTPLNAKAG